MSRPSGGYNPSHRRSRSCWGRKRRKAGCRSRSRSFRWTRRTGIADLREKRLKLGERRVIKINHHGGPTVGGRHEIPAGVASHAREDGRVEVFVVLARVWIPVFQHFVVPAERTREGGERNCDERQVTIATASGAIHICCASRPGGVAMPTTGIRLGIFDFTGDSSNAQ